MEENERQKRLRKHSKETGQLTAMWDPELDLGREKKISEKTGKI